MRILSTVSRLSLVAFLSISLAPPTIWAQARTATATATVAPLPAATPESVGFTPGGLDKMDEGMQAIIDNAAP